MADLHEKQQLSILRSMYERGDIHHAYLFIGSLLSGKTEIAEEFLKCIPVYERKECSQDPQAAIRAISIEKIREVKYALSRAAPASHYRVIWIEPADALTKEAANALLKLIEEPPPMTIFLLFAQSARSVLGTIRSRCHILRFCTAGTEKCAEGMNGSPLFSASISGDRKEKLFLATSLAFDELPSFESDLEKYIHNARSPKEYGMAVHAYHGISRLMAARMNNVSEQGCIDLAHLEI